MSTAGSVAAPPVSPPVPRVAAAETLAASAGRSERSRAGRLPRPSTSLLALASYVLAAVALSWPLARDAFRGAVPLHDIDVWQALWQDWWLRRVLLHGASFRHTTYLFYPHGVDLATASSSPTFSLLSLLFSPLAGPLGGFDLAIVAVLAIGGWGAYLLARELTGSEAASFVAGLVYAFAPYHLTQLIAHPNLGSVEWWPFMALFLVRALRPGHPGAAIAAGLFFALALWSGFHLGLLGGLWALAFVGWSLATEPAARDRRVLLQLALAAAVALALAAPALWMVRQALAADGGGGLILDERDRGQTDLLAYVLPPRLHPLLGRFTAATALGLGKNAQWIPYFGLAALALAVWAAVREGRRARFWWLSGLLWVVLALGAFLRVGGVPHRAVRLPWDLVDDRFPFSALRSADRFNLLVPLSLAVLVALALARLASRRIAALAGALIVAEVLCVPLPTQPGLPLSPFLHRMAADPARYAVLDLPLGRQPSKCWMYYQTVHGKPIVEGMAARTTAATFAYLQGLPLLRAFADERAAAPPDVAGDLRRLAADGVRYVIVHRRFVPRRTLHRWRRWMPAPPVYQDVEVLVFATGS